MSLLSDIDGSFYSVTTLSQIDVSDHEIRTKINRHRDSHVGVAGYSRYMIAAILY